MKNKFFNKIIRLTVSALLLVAVVIPAVGIIPGNIVKADGENWLTGWDYRVSKLIGASESVANFTVTGGGIPLYLHTGNGTSNATDLFFNGKCKDYFDDVRVTTSDGDTEIPYYIRSGNQTDGELCLLADVGVSPITVYIYYGNEDATRKSDVYSTFIDAAFEREGNIIFSGTPSTGTGSYNAHGGICRLHDGTLFSCWDSGIGHHDNGNEGFYSVSLDGGRTWSAPTEFITDVSLEIDTPMPAEFYIDSTWTIIVSFSKQDAGDPHGEDQKAYVIKGTNYTDNWGSETWGSHITVAGTGADEDARHCRSRVIEASDGNHYFVTQSGGTNDIYLQKSTDDCDTWAETAIAVDDVALPGESSIIEIKDGGEYNGDFYVLSRSGASPDYPIRYLSTDYGSTWGSSSASGLTPNRGDALDLIRLSTGELVVAWTNRADDDDGEIRLAMPSAEDEDLTWDTTNYSMPWRYRGTLGSSDYAYPSICEIEDGGQIGLMFYAGASDSVAQIHFYFVPLSSFHGSYFSYSSTAKISHDSLTTWNQYVTMDEAYADDNLASKQCNPSVTKYWIEWRMKNTSQGSVDANPLFGTQEANDTNVLFLIRAPAKSDQININYKSASTNYNLTSDDYTEGTIYRFRVLVDEDGAFVSYYLYSDVWSALYSATGKAYADGSPSSMNYLLLGSFTPTGTANSQWYGGIQVRKYTATEPAWVATGSEEEAPSVSAPTVTSVSSASIEETTANLTGNITATGDENPDTRGFQWGTSTGVYSTNQTESGNFSTGTFWLNVTSLPPGDEVYWRATANNSGGYGYGSEKYLETKPNDPDSLTSPSHGETWIYLTWNKGTGSENTTVRYQSGSYPATYNDGSSAYNGTGTSVNVTSLSSNTTYYFRAWSISTDNTTIYSDGYSQVTQVTSSPGANPPTLTTSAATDVDYKSVTGNGNITDVGSSNPTERGFQYGIGAFTDNVSESGNFSTGAYSLSIIGLASGTEYQYRAYAINAVGIGYGGSVNFTTLTEYAPTVITANATDIDCESATGNGNITSIGTANVTYRGFQYKYHGDWDTSDNVSESGNWGTGVFNLSITGLEDNIEYEYRAFAQNSVNITYALSANFTTTASADPTVTTGNATSVGYTTATLHATISGLTCDDTSSIIFEWGTETGNYTDNWETVLPYGNESLSHGVTGLTDNTTYYYRVRAKISGESYQNGNEVEFTTNALPESSSSTSGFVDALPLLITAILVFTIARLGLSGNITNIEGLIILIVVIYLVFMVIVGSTEIIGSLG